MLGQLRNAVLHLTAKTDCEKSIGLAVSVDFSGSSVGMPRCNELGRTQAALLLLLPLPAHEQLARIQLSYL